MNYAEPSSPDSDDSRDLQKVGDIAVAGEADPEDEVVEEDMESEDDDSDHAAAHKEEAAGPSPVLFKEMVPPRRAARSTGPVRCNRSEADSEESSGEDSMCLASDDSAGGNASRKRGGKAKAGGERKAGKDRSRKVSIVSLALQQLGFLVIQCALYVTDIIYK